MRKHKVLFIRRYHGLLGGHLKVFDYARHLVASDRFEPVLYLTPDSTADPRDYVPSEVRRVTSLLDADIYFVAGLNWNVLDESHVEWRRRPVVNLLQGFRHVDLNDRRRAFLKRPALRICVSETLREAVLGTGTANGPIIAIENGVDLNLFSPGMRDSTNSVLIAGIKNPQTAFAIATLLEGQDLDVTVQTAFERRDAFLQRLRRSTVAVTLPFAREGFFLPALEAMAAGCAVVVPDCVGTRSYCVHEQTALVPAYTPEAIACQVVRLFRDPSLCRRLRIAARTKAEQHSLERERVQFVHALNMYLGDVSHAKVQP